jgi:hypothetical protein
MKELNKWQVAHLKKFLIRHYVRYEDVQLELIDHLASSIEEKMNQDSNLSFEKALDQVYASFGVGGFAKIVEQKTKEMRRFWRIHIWKVFLEFLRPPLLFISVGLYGLFYFGQTFLQVSFLNSVGVLSLFFVIIIIAFSYHQFVKEEKLNKYLFYNTYQAVSVGIMYTTIYLLPYPFWGTDGAMLSNFSHLTIAFTSFFFTLNLILLYVLAYQIPTGLLAKYKSEYKYFNLA